VGVEREVVVVGERVMLPDGERAAAIYVRDGRIVAIASHAARPAGVRVFDAGALVVLPGLVDTHVHMNDPGRADWEGAAHATRAAAAGGVTTLVDMPLNSIPATTSVEALHAKQQALEGHCHVDVAFWGGIVPGNTSQLGPLAAEGVRGFKCFLSPSGVDEFAHVTAAELREALPRLARLQLPLLVHAELPARLRPPEGEPRVYTTWLNSRPPDAEGAAIDLLIELAAESGARVHVVHLASSDALPALRAARRRGLPVTVETCPHYLTFAAEDVGDGATALKCAPPIRERRHREALWQALLDGDIDLVVTDHSPAPAALKHIQDGDFIEAWGGIASLQVGVAVVATGAAARNIPLERVARWMAAGPARLAGLEGRKGAIVPGADADLAVWDPDAERIIDPSMLHHRHPVTPYAGMTLRGEVRTTILRGAVVFSDGTVASHPGGRMIGARA
jgi:allantoinase